jgi:uncharacterized protein
VSPGEPEPRFLPGLYPIDAYGNGGFRFADISHRGSLLALPSGMRVWPVRSAAELTAAAFAPVFAEAAAIELFLLGTGPDLVPLREALRWRFREARIAVEPMATGAAARTYNVLLQERRRVAAGLIAVA